MTVRRLFLAFETRFVGRASAAELGHVRAVTCLAAMAVHLRTWYLPTSAAVPPGLFRRLGIMQIVGRLPGFQALLSSESALAALWCAGLVALALAMVGYRSRLTVPMAAAIVLVSGGILRGYSYFFHTGLLPNLLLFLLALVPCGDGFSLDARRRRRTDPDGSGAQANPSLTYGWSRWACWLIVTSTYVVAACSKLRYGGLGWWRAETMRNITVKAALQDGGFHSEFAGSMLNAPDLVFTAMGIFGLGIELAALFLLVSSRARRWVPIGIILLHTSVWLVQKIVFVDAIILQAIFLLTAWAPRVKAAAGAPAPAPAPASMPKDARRPRLIVAATAAFAAVQCVVWVVGIEWYPLTGWQMYSTLRNSRVGYSRMYLRFASGRRESLEGKLPRLLASTLRTHASACWKSGHVERPPCRALFEAALTHARASAGDGPDPVVAIERDTYRWNYRKAPHDPNRGRLKGHFVWPPDETASPAPVPPP